LIDALSNYLFFVTVVEAGSLTKAAKRLRLPKSKVSRRLAQLEQQLGSQLLIRTTRKQQLTESGLLLYQSCKPHVEALNGMEQLVSDATTKIRGKLSLLLPLEFFNKVISTIITNFAYQYPDIEIHCQHYSATYPEFDYQYDLVFVLHERQLPTSNWIGKNLLSFPQSIYVAKENHKHNDISIQQLNREKAILSTPDEQWFFRDDEQLHVCTPDLAMVLSSPEMRVQACQRNIGLIKLPDYIGSNNTKIKQVIMNKPLAAQQLTLLYQSRNIPVKTRMFLDYFQSNIGCLT